MSRLFIGLPLIAVLFLAACGSGNTIRGTNGSGGSSGKGGGGGGGGGGSVGSPNSVTVTAGQTTSGVNVTVVSAASATPPNAEGLGVAATASGALATSTGGTLKQGTTQTVVLFGPGLSGSMTVSVRGPADIVVSNIQSVTATDGTPGIAFSAAASASAALGARTVVLQASNGDVTTFTGGLEIVP